MFVFCLEITLKIHNCILKYFSIKSNVMARFKHVSVTKKAYAYSNVTATADLVFNNNTLTTNPNTAKDGIIVVLKFGHKKYINTYLIHVPTFINGCILDSVNCKTRTFSPECNR